MVFGACNASQTANILSSAGLSDAEVAAFLHKDRTTTVATGTTIAPTETMILGLKAEMRAKLYRELARWPENKLCVAPYHLTAEPIRPIFASKSIKPETIDLIRSLTFQRGGITCFSDVNLVLNRLSSAEEKSACCSR